MRIDPDGQPYLVSARGFLGGCKLRGLCSQEKSFNDGKHDFGRAVCVHVWVV